MKVSRVGPRVGGSTKTLHRASRHRRARGCKPRAVGSSSWAACLFSLGQGYRRVSFIEYERALSDVRLINGHVACLRVPFAESPVLGLRKD